MVGREKPRFYTWNDENGVIHTAKNENNYNDNISGTTPILSLRTLYWYNPGVENAIVGQIIGGNETFATWLASSSVSIGSGDKFEYVSFDLRYVFLDATSGHGLYYSSGVIAAHTLGVHPVISFNISRLNISDVATNGSSTSPWNIK